MEFDVTRKTKFTPYMLLCRRFYQILCLTNNERFFYSYLAEYGKSNAQPCRKTRYVQQSPKCSKVHRYKQPKGVLHHRSTFIILSFRDLNYGRKDVFWLMFSVSDAGEHFVIWKINFLQKFAIWCGKILVSKMFCQKPIAALKCKIYLPPRVAFAYKNYSNISRH